MENKGMSSFLFARLPSETIKLCISYVCIPHDYVKEYYERVLKRALPSSMEKNQFHFVDKMERCQDVKESDYHTILTEKVRGSIFTSNGWERHDELLTCYASSRLSWSFRRYVSDYGRRDWDRIWDDRWD